MLTSIATTLLTAWSTGRPTRTSPKGWVSGNAVCCTHNGESVDKRGRGGVIISPDGTATYSCFNCGFKTKYVPGYQLGYRFRRLLEWLGVDSLEVYRLSIEALREQERQELLGLVVPDEEKEELKVEFKKFPLPPEAKAFTEMITEHDAYGTPLPSKFYDCLGYIADRRINVHSYDFYWSPDRQYQMNTRVIIPLKWQNEVIGYTARALNDTLKPKYYAQHDSGYIFNMDAQRPEWKFVIVTEGPFDALSIDGVAVMRSDVSQQQIDIIESLNREIIVVPDWNKSGQNMIDVAVKNGWSVSFPVWSETCVDINAAVVKYGKLFVLKTILDSVEHSELRIYLKRKKYR